MSEEWQAIAEAAEGQPACSPDLVPIDWVDKWRARAEAAEARVRELEADLNDAHAHHYYLRDRAEAAEAALGLGQRQQYSDADYLSLHKAHCHTAEQLAEAERQLAEVGAILAGTDISSLPDDMTLADIARARMADHVRAAIASQPET